MIYTIRSSSLYEVSKVVRRLQNAAKRNGWPAPTMKTLTKVYATVNFQAVVDVEIDVPQFEMDGWRIVGEVRPNGRFFEFTREHFAEQFAGLPFACQHCGKQRKRTAVFAAAHEGGERRLVGSSCLDEFTGVLNAERYAGYLQSIFCSLEKIVDGQNLHLMSRAVVIPTNIAIISTVAAIRTHGFVSGFGANATHKTVLNYLQSGAGLDVTEEDVTVAENIFSTGKMGEENSVTFVAALPGVVVEIYKQYRAVLESAAPSEWVGKIGQHIVVNVKIVEGCKLVGQAWDSWLYTGYTSKGEKITVFSSKELPLTVGSTVSLDGKVKKHDVYRGVKSTVLNYVKAL